MDRSRLKNFVHDVSLVSKPVRRSDLILFLPIDILWRNASCCQKISFPRNSARTFLCIVRKTCFVHNTKHKYVIALSFTYFPIFKRVALGLPNILTQICGRTTRPCPNIPHGSFADLGSCRRASSGHSDLLFLNLLRLQQIYGRTKLWCKEKLHFRALSILSRSKCLTATCRTIFILSCLMWQIMRFRHVCMQHRYSDIKSAVKC